MGRYLRIALVKNRQPFEERYVPMGVDVTLGKAAGNTFVVPDADVPKSTTLFKALGADRHTLIFGNPSGRVELVEGEVELLEELVKKGLAERHERVFQLPLTLKARGKFDVGDITVLFHYVERDLALKQQTKASGPRPLVLETVLSWEGTVMSTMKWDPVRPVTMGPGPLCDIQLPGRVLESRAYPIIDGAEGRFYVDLRNPFITVESAETREAPAERYPLKGPFKMTLALREGFSLDVRYTPALTRSASSPFDITDPLPLSLAGSALFHAALMLIAFAIGQGLLDPHDAKAKKAERRRELSAMLQEQKVEAKQEEAKKEAEKKEEEKKPEEAKKEDAKPEPKPLPRKKEEVADAGSQTPEARKTKLKESVREKTFLGVLGGSGEQGDNTVPVGREAQYADAFNDVQGDYAVNGAPSDGMAPPVAREGGQDGGQYKKLSDDEKGGGSLDTANVKTADKGASEEAAVKVNVRTGSLGGEGGLGKIDNGAVAGVFSRRIGAIKSCYEKELRRNPNLKGRITLRFTIGTSGRITNINASQNTTGDDAIASCIIGKVQNWKFDPPQGGAVTFTYPFILEAR